MLYRETGFSVEHQPKAGGFCEIQVKAALRSAAFTRRSPRLWQ